MREIKFRAMALGRDGTMQMMYSRDEPNLSQYFSWTDDFEQQQYTGLKDKNGVEIYEGDIVTRPHLGYNYQVEFKMNGWLFTRSTGYKQTENIEPNHMGWYKHCEVIGNIYENPELLEGKTK